MSSSLAVVPDRHHRVVPRHRRLFLLSFTSLIFYYSREYDSLVVQVAGLHLHLTTACVCTHQNRYPKTGRYYSFRIFCHTGLLYAESPFRMYCPSTVYP